jgi:hypothetical protein
MNTNAIDIQIEIEQGIKFILSHFSEPIYPRRIFTPIEKQVTIYSFENIAEKFIEARFEDCRISAYPYYGQKQHWYLGYQRPDLVFVDLDNNRFKNTAALDRALKKTQENIKNKLCCYDAVPTILESGTGGYHIIQPLQAPDLKNIDYFTKWSKEPNKEFIRFLEPFLSPKADPNHYHNVSMNNCLLRVPGTINSKTKIEVKVKQRWNGIRPDIKYVYANFIAYLIDNQESVEGSKQQYRDWSRNRYNRMDWAEYCRK